MEKQKIKAEYVAVDALVPYKNNARTHSEEQIEQLRKSMREFGFVNPVLIDEHNNIIAGHGRVMAARAEGMMEVPCVYVENMTEAQRRAYIIADNQLALNAGWDLGTLQVELAALEDLDFEIGVLGFDKDFLDELSDFGSETDPEDDDFDTTPPEDPVSEVGDIYQLGNHRLICGDATDPDVVNALVGEKRVQMIFTDPPWNVDYGSDTNHPSWRSRQILNDKMSAEDFHEFMLLSFQNMASVAEPGCMAYVVMSAQEWGNIMDVMESVGYHWSSTIIWAKDSLVLSRKDYHTQYEPIWYGWLDGSRLCPLTDRKQSDIWEIPRPKRSEEHPTMKPVPLVARAIQNSSRKGDVVLDLFGGSGTTLIAAEQTGRCCHMLELDPKYADVIVKRYIATAGTDGISLQRSGRIVDNKSIIKLFKV